MKKILIIYASMTGHTEVIAEILEQALKEEGFKVTVKEALRTKPKEMLKYDAVLLGSYTYEGGEIGDDFMLFYEDMERVNLAGKITAVFGSGDTFYEDTFCVAVDLITEKLHELGAKVVLDGLKIDLVPDGEDEDRCWKFGKDFADKVRELIPS
ncbi:flavodoxin [Bacillus sp. FJAT-49736]|uniref:flavodoxin n=1 Tax=Bacillus sp. FJAT-49736 TaxID=2833582 RepID=UPI001BCA53E3|nr:flavodoxin [Bacillus sp. FJAT-49736]MBS4172808.1 flavodoxin [Bacillus sp. FJAT-49736]